MQCISWKCLNESLPFALCVSNGTILANVRAFYSLIFRRCLSLCVLLTLTVTDYSSCPALQGVTVELLRGSAPPGSDMDVSCARHHRPALCTLPDPVCRLWLAGRLRHRHGALHPAQRGACMWPHITTDFKTWFYLILVPAYLYDCMLWGNMSSCYERWSDLSSGEWV